MNNESTTTRVCQQCEGNAKFNEDGGYHELAEECREYCRRDFSPLEARVWIRRGTSQVVPLSELEMEVIGTSDAIEYAHLAPIRAALEKCSPYKTDVGSVVMSASSWDALVALIKGEK